MLVTFWDFSSTLMMEVICSSEMSVDFCRTSQRYIPEDNTFFYPYWVLTYFFVSLYVCRSVYIYYRLWDHLAVLCVCVSTCLCVPLIVFVFYALPFRIKRKKTINSSQNYFFIYQTIFRKQVKLHQYFWTLSGCVPLGVMQLHVPVSVATAFLSQRISYCAK
jgi:hypothetical protein